MSESLTAPSREQKANPQRAKKTYELADPSSILGRAATRDYEKAQQLGAVCHADARSNGKKKLRLNPADKMNGQFYRQTPALVVGDLAHRFLQNWEFTGDVKELRARNFTISSLCAAERIRIILPRDRIRASKRFSSAFFRSKVYAELAGARILGREVPLLMPWNGQIMEGVIDLDLRKKRLALPGRL